MGRAQARGRDGIECAIRWALDVGFDVSGARDRADDKLENLAAASAQIFGKA